MAARGETVRSERCDGKMTKSQSMEGGKVHRARGSRGGPRGLLRVCGGLCEKLVRGESPAARTPRGPSMRARERAPAAPAPREPREPRAPHPTPQETDLEAGPASSRGGTGLGSIRGGSELRESWGTETHGRRHAEGRVTRLPRRTQAWGLWRRPLNRGTLMTQLATAAPWPTHEAWALPRSRQGG